MNEPTEFKYPLDENGEPYFAGSHINAIQGMEEYKEEVDSRINSVQSGGETNNSDLKALETKVDSLVGDIIGLGNALNGLISDTGWYSYQVNPAYGENQGVVGGFNCSIREIRITDIVIKSIRVNLGKVTNDVQVAQLPVGFITKTQTIVSRSNSNDNAIQFSARENGNLWAYVNKADQELGPRWAYFEHTWID